MIKHIVGALHIGLLLSVVAPLHAEIATHRMDVAQHALNGNANELEVALVDGQINSIDNRGNTPLHLAVYALNPFVKNYEKVTQENSERAQDSAFPIVGGALGAATMTGLTWYVLDAVYNSVAGMKINQFSNTLPASPTVGGAIIGWTAGALLGATIKNLPFNIEKMEQRAIPAAALCALLVWANRANGNDNMREFATYGGLGAAALLVGPDLIGQIGYKIGYIARDTVLGGSGANLACAAYSNYNLNAELEQRIETIMILVENGADLSAENNEGLTAADLAYSIAAATQNVALQSKLLALAHTLGA